jgi:hypothetical protein
MDNGTWFADVAGPSDLENVGPMEDDHMDDAGLLGSWGDEEIHL